jgi:transcriptional regulator with XRE-family HTH domain
LQPTGDWLNQPGGLAERLQRLRKAAGLTGERMAADLGWPRTKISKLENGRQMPAEADLTSWAAECGQPEETAGLLELLAEAQSMHRQYRHQVRLGHAALQQDFDQLVRESTLIRNIEVAVIPGLLQTAGYARYRALEAVRVHGYPEGEVEATVAARMRRQDVLYDEGRRFEFVFTEAALRLLLCPPQVMLGQIDRLASVSGLANITVGIIPFGVELPVAPMVAFLIAGETTVIETHTGDTYVRGEESERFERIADSLLAEAVTGDQAGQLLTAASAWLRERTDP